MSRFSKEKIETFNAELHLLVQRYLDMKDVDALALADRLSKHAEMADIIGIRERQEFREQT